MFSHTLIAGIYTDIPGAGSYLAQLLERLFHGAKVAIYFELSKILEGFHPFYRKRAYFLGKNLLAYMAFNRSGCPFPKVETKDDEHKHQY